MKKVFLSLLLGCFRLYGDNQINHHPPMTNYIVQTQLSKGANFFLLDVGASGGIEPYWNAFGRCLCGFGFDPLIKECERLNSINVNPRFTYLPYYVVSGKEEPSMDPQEDPSVVGRSSAWKMLQNSKMNYTKEVFNKGQEVILSQEQISLDQFCLEREVKAVDFLKIDTDGFDYGVLRGSENLLNSESLLGVLVECSFNAQLHPYSNSFRNVDSFLVGKGFTLFDLSIWRYTKAALPGRFLYRIPAQTTSGQVSWGDAFYLRDFVHMKKNGKEIPTIQLLKMVCLQEIFGLPDCAAELLLAFRDQLTFSIDVDHCLNLLTKDMNLFKSYQQHMAEFQKNPTQFYPR